MGIPTELPIIINYYDGVCITPKLVSTNSSVVNLYLIKRWRQQEDMGHSRQNSTKFQSTNEMHNNESNLLVKSIKQNSQQNNESNLQLTNLLLQSINLNSSTKTDNKRI